MQAGADSNCGDYVLYELHVGTFTPEGTFDGAIRKLEYLKQLGVTVVEVMPVAACPGARNWGYDGVSPYAVQANYGGPDGLKRFVDAAHRRGLGVMLDVVYNHLGPEGNYLPKFGPYFTAHHKTPWGDAVNYDSEESEHVRSYVVQNALYWIREYHLDGLRLDAVQTIKDDSPRHIVAEVQENVQRLARELSRNICVIAETDENDSRYVKPMKQGGYGLNAVWSDDFHHAVHAFFTAERKGYYQDFGDPAADRPRVARRLRLSRRAFRLLEWSQRHNRARRSDAGQCDLHPKSRSSRQSCDGRPHDEADSARSPQGRRCPAAACTAHASAIHGTGV